MYVDVAVVMSVLMAGFRKTRVFLKKPNPGGFLGFIGFYWVLDFIGFIGRAVPAAV